uniref:Uncharacterized protein n=1 Tax=Helianthus annuus TaxID=4232 RepID=A0A251U6K8_HELAN
MCWISTIDLSNAQTKIILEDLCLAQQCLLISFLHGPCLTKSKLGVTLLPATNCESMLIQVV